jgi:hypothetical protein
MPVNCNNILTAILKTSMGKYHKPQKKKRLYHVKWYLARYFGSGYLKNP